MKSVMISCRQRRETERAITLQELRKVDIRPTVAESLCDPACGAENRRVSWEALQHIPEGGLFLEDDILVNERLFPQMLSMAVERDVVTTFTVFRQSLHPPGTFDNLTPRLVRLVNTQSRRGFYGTQCLYLPKWAMNLVYENRDKFVRRDGSALPGEDDVHGFDFWVKDTFPVIYMAFPNPVEHRAPPKMRKVSRGLPGNQRGHRSLSYRKGLRLATQEG